MTKDQQKTQEALHDIPMFKVSPNADMKILQAIEDLHAMQKSSPFSFPSITAFFSSIEDYFDLSKWFDLRRLAPVCAVFLLIFGILFQGNFRSYDYHLGKAQGYLGHLENALEGELQQISFIPVALADSDKSVDEKLVARLTEKIVKHTEAAIEAAEKLNEIWDAGKAFSEINEIQENTIEILSDAAVITKSQPITQIVAQAIRTTAQEREEVEKLVDTFEEVVQKNQPAVIVVEVKTSGDKEMKEARKREEKIRKSRESAKIQNKELPTLPEVSSVTQQNVESIEKFVNDVKTDESVNKEDVTKMEGKLNIIKKALNEGETHRAEALQAALDAKKQSITRKTSHEKIDWDKLKETRIKTKNQQKESFITPEDTTDKKSENPNPVIIPTPTSSGNRINFEALKENRQNKSLFSRLRAWKNDKTEAGEEINNQPKTSGPEQVQVQVQEQVQGSKAEKIEKFRNRINELKNLKNNKKTGYEEENEENEKTPETQETPEPENTTMPQKNPPAETEASTPEPGPEPEPEVEEPHPVPQSAPEIKPKKTPEKHTPSQVKKEAPKLSPEVLERFRKAKERLEEVKRKKLEEIENRKKQNKTETGVNEESESGTEITGEGSGAGSSPGAAEEAGVEGASENEENNENESGSESNNEENNTKSRSEKFMELKERINEWQENYKEYKQSQESENQPESSGESENSGGNSGEGETNNDTSGAKYYWWRR